MTKRFALASLAAWMILTGVILGAFANEALPTPYLIRPLGAALPMALVIGGLSLLAGRRSVLLAAAVSLALLLATLPVALVLLAAVLAARLASLRRMHLPVDALEATLALAGIFLGLSMVRVVLSLGLLSATISGPSHPSPTGFDAPPGPPIYVVLLDGYPRVDTLANLGIDNTLFIEALEARGFDHYPDATTTYRYTHKTLLAILTDDTIADGPSSIEEKRDVRERLLLPPGWVAIDPPVGHVVLSGGRHVTPGGFNDFEAHLLGQSALGVVARDWVAILLGESLRGGVEFQFRLLETMEGRVFAHVLSPHPPFLYAADGSPRPVSACWPACDLFDSTVERLGISQTQWAQGMGAQLTVLNARVIEAVDSIRADHEDAVVVLFSDHGGRYTYEDEDEWHRSFLASLTPGFPNLFGESPGPEDILRKLELSYPAAGR